MVPLQTIYKVFKRLTPTRFNNFKHLRHTRCKTFKILPYIKYNTFTTASHCSCRRQKLLKQPLQLSRYCQTTSATYSSCSRTPVTTSNASVDQITKYQQMSDDVCEKFWKWRIVNFPEFATSVGEHKYDHILNDMTLEGFERKYIESKYILNEVEDCIAKLRSNSVSCVNLELLYAEFKIYISGFASKSYLHPINHIEGPLFRFNDLLARMKKDTKDDYDLILTRLALFPKQN